MLPNQKINNQENSGNTILSKLKQPFKPDEIEFRLAQCGESNNGKIWAMCLAYISARAIQDRLDEVCGPENWKVAYEFISTTGVICNLSIKIGNEWVTKQDGAEFTEIESFKGGISSALKRAGSAWGMGRYLYSLESGFAEIVDKNVKGAQFGKTKSGKTFYWIPPQLPDWALPNKPSTQAPITPISKPSIENEKAESKSNSDNNLKIIDIQQPKETNTAQPVQATVIRGPSTAQLRRMFTLANKCGVKNDEIKTYILNRWKKTSSKDLSLSEYDYLVDALEAGQVKTETEGNLELPTQPAEDSVKVSHPNSVTESDLPWNKYLNK